MNLKNYFLIVLVLFACKEDEPVSETEQLAVELSKNLEGSWHVYDVWKDIHFFDEWKGIQIVFESSGPVNGSYEMKNSLYDSIWPNKGTWRLEYEVIQKDSAEILVYQFFRNDTTEMDISFSVYPDSTDSSSTAMINELNIEMLLPHTVSEYEREAECSYDSALMEMTCREIFEGRWNFQFFRSER